MTFLVDCLDGVCLDTKKEAEDKEIKTTQSVLLDIKYVKEGHSSDKIIKKRF